MIEARPRRVPVVELPAAPRTRFAPAPTGLLHLGHVANAIYTWGVARAAGGTVDLRIEDHDRQRSRAAFERALLEDLEWLGFVPDRPAFEDLRAGPPSPWRQSDSGAAYASALAILRTRIPVYACRCTRATFEAFEREAGRAWAGPGCPAHCARLGLDESDDMNLRVALGDGDESWTDLLGGPITRPVATAGDLIVRDRLGNWTYAFAVVVDDLRHGIDLVVRGADLVDDTGRQIRLGRLLGRPAPPRFAHHPLVRRPDGSKLSKSAGDTAVRELREAGASAADVVGAAAAAVGLVPYGRPVAAGEVPRLVVDAATG